MRFYAKCSFYCVLVTLAFIRLTAAEDRPLLIGKEAEARFPPLQVPEGFRATLFACDPLIEFPSVIAIGPRPISLFVANDYVKGMGTEITRRDDIRLLEDTDRDGYADRAPVFAEGFGSIQGLEYSDDTLFVMHAPLLTSLRDTNGDGVADERRDLLSGLGLPPENNPSRLHCANGIVAGHDGWLYLAMGDNGCNIARPEGDNLVVNGGAILRCRKDGSQLHIYATGIRNVYDIALDDQLNVFFRDNENDGGDYMVRICFSFFGADHGYPYHYYERPDEGLAPLADLGRGSSAGGVCYRETSFPPEMRGKLFFCEWGRAVMHAPLMPAGSAFADTHEQQFAAGSEADPYGFKPTDIVVMEDGSMMVSDWADEQATGRGRARIYRIQYANAEPNREPETNLTLQQLIERLDHQSYLRRVQAQRMIEQHGPEGLELLKKNWEANKLGVHARNHAIWIMAHLDEGAVETCFRILKDDPAAEVRVQAVRAIADLSDPVFVQKKLDADPSQDSVASSLAETYIDQSPAVQREIISAIGRLKWRSAPEWLAQVLPDQQSDPFLAHAAMQTMRRSQNWAGILKLLERKSGDPVRTIALRALANESEPQIAEALIELLVQDADEARRREYADLLTRIHRRPGPWTYWGYRPGPRPANAVEWSHTGPITEALHRLLASGDAETCLFLLNRMQRENIPTTVPSLAKWLQRPDHDEVVTAVLQALAAHPAADVRPIIRPMIVDSSRAVKFRLAALELYARELDQGSAASLLPLAADAEDGQVLVQIIQALTKHRQLNSVELCSRKLNSPSAEVRAASIEALIAFEAKEYAEQIVERLHDQDAQVRAAAVKAVGVLLIDTAAPLVDQIMRRERGELVALGFRALEQLVDPRAMDLAAAALREPVTELAALKYIAAVGSAEHATAVSELALRSNDKQILHTAISALTDWSDAEQLPSERKSALLNTIDEIQGRHGVFLSWKILDHVMESELPAALQVAFNKDHLAPFQDRSWGNVLADQEGRLPARNSALPWLGATKFQIDEPIAATLQITCAGSLRAWVNGVETAEHTGESPISACEVELGSGMNQIVILAGSGGMFGKSDSPVRIELRRKASSEEHEQLMRLALQQAGNAENGRALFANVQRTQCLKCHRLGEQGERIGPELNDIGRRFSRIHLIESILTPSRFIGPSFQPTSIVLQDGRVLTGLVLSSDDQALILADQKAEKHSIRREDIEEQIPQTVSVMPEGLEKQITPAEFVDLIEFLTSQK